MGWFNVFSVVRPEPFLLQSYLDPVNTRVIEPKSIPHQSLDYLTSSPDLHLTLNPNITPFVSWNSLDVDLAFLFSVFDHLLFRSKINEIAALSFSFCIG